MTRSLFARLAVVAVFMFMIFVNYLSNALPINGVTAADVSGLYPSLFTPAGFTFAIWGVIYLTLLGFVVYQILPGQKHDDLMAQITPLFIVNALANAGWLLLWHYGFMWGSLLVMFVILATLILISRKIYQARRSGTLGRWVFVALPFSLYLGWITAASLANISLVQSSEGWNDLWLSQENWTLLKLALVGAVAAYMALRIRAIPYVLVIAWASFGIASKQIDTPVISGAAQLLCLLALLLAAFALLSGRGRSRS